MADNHTMPGQSRVKFLLLAVVKNIVFVAVCVVIDNVCLPHVSQRLHVCNGSIGHKLYRLRPSAHHFLISCIARRHETLSVICACVHQIPASHAVVSAVGGVVHVRKAHTMREFMAEDSDAGYRIAANRGVP